MITYVPLRVATLSARRGIETRIQYEPNIVGGSECDALELRCSEKVREV